MNTSLRLALLAVLALVLTCLCLARPIRRGRVPQSGCVQGCGNYCRELGLIPVRMCKSCYCFAPTPVAVGCSGSSSGYTGCSGVPSSGCDGSGCDGSGGCGGGGCGGGGCGGGC